MGLLPRQRMLHSDLRGCAGLRRKRDLSLLGQSASTQGPGAGLGSGEGSNRRPEIGLTGSDMGYGFV